MPAPTISPLPSPPSRSTDPTNFATEADAFVAALPEFVSDANAQASYLDGVAAAVDADAAAAAASAADALVSETNAAASAAGAASAADVGAWVSGATYAIGDCVFSLVDFQTYRRITNGAGTIDPSSNPTNWIAITGAGSNVVKALASGSLSDGTKVVLNSDGTVSAITKTTTQLSPVTLDTNQYGQYTNGLRKIAVACSAKRNLIAIAFDNNNPGIFVYIGEIVANKIVWGGYRSLNFSSSLNAVSLAFDDLYGQLIVAYQPTSDYYGYVTVGYLYFDGYAGYWNVQFGNNTAFQSSTSNYVNVRSIPDTDKFIVTYSSSGVNAKVGTLALKSATFGAMATATASSPGYMAMCHTGGNNFAVAWRQSVGTAGIYAAAASFSGTTITFGTPLNISGATIYGIDCACDINNQKMVVAIANFSSQGVAYVVSISGTTLTAGGSATLTGNTDTVRVTFDPYANNFAFFYKNNTASNAIYGVSGTISGTTLTLTTAAALNSGLPYSVTFDKMSAAFFPYMKKPVSVYYDDGNYMNTVTMNTATVSTNLSGGSYLGISSGAYTNGQEAKIQVVGAVDDAQSGLTPGAAYYVGMDGSLKRTLELWEPTVFAGTAITATKLLVKG